MTRKRMQRLAVVLGWAENWQIWGTSACSICWILTQLCTPVKETSILKNEAKFWIGLDDRTSMRKYVLKWGWNQSFREKKGRSTERSSSSKASRGLWRNTGGNWLLPSSCTTSFGIRFYTSSFHTWLRKGSSANDHGTDKVTVFTAKAVTLCTI